MVTFGKKKIGDGNKVFITFEVGPTHNGLSSAKNLVSQAAKAGADAVKFQMLDADRLVADKKVMFEYDILYKNNKTKRVKDSLYNLLKKRMLKPEEWIELKKFADKKKIHFFATPGFIEEIVFLVKIGCKCIKIASSDVNHFPLIRHAAKKKVCIQLDTGNSTLKEIENAIKIIEKEKNRNIIIHHCPSGYPAKTKGINLNIIKTLKKTFSYPIAFSDHSPGWEMDIAAVSMGANLVEKTITEDRTTKSVEHIFSIEKEDLKKFVDKIHSLEIALGNHKRIMTKEELKKREFVRRSAYLKKTAIKGTFLQDLEIEFRRPGFSISPDIYDKILKKNMILKRNLPSGHKLKIKDLSPLKKSKK